MGLLLLRIKMSIKMPPFRLFLVYKVGIRVLLLVDAAGIAVWAQISTSFNLYTETFKRQEVSRCKNSKPKCFKTKNFHRFYRHQFCSYS